MADTTPAGRLLTVRFPELPISTYLRWIAWWNRFKVAMLSDPTLEAIAAANGVRALDRDIEYWVATVHGAISDEAAEAAEHGQSTVAPVVVASSLLWTDYLALADSRTEWLERVAGTHTAEHIPYPTDEVRRAREMFRDAILFAMAHPEPSVEAAEPLRSGMDGLP